MTMQVPGSDQRNTDLRLVHDDDSSSGGGPEQALGLLENARRVADSTLGLMLTWYPKVAGPAVETFSRALMDQPLREALGYAAPPPRVEKIVRGALRARGRMLRVFPARMSEQGVADLRWVRSYPDGHDVTQLGTFPVPGVAGCPVRHDADSA